MKELKAHKCADRMPKMTKAAFNELVQSIKTDGFDPDLPVLATEDGEIIDGRHRYHAALKAGVDCKIQTYRGPMDEPTLRRLVRRRNVYRRQLTDAQLAMLAADETDDLRAQTDDSTSARAQEPRQVSHAKSDAEAAKEYGVSARSVGVARNIKAKSPEQADAVRAGKKSLRQAEADTKPATAEPGPVKDEIGGEVPERLAGMFTDIRFEELAGQLRAVKKGIKALTDDSLGVWLHAQDVLASLENVIKAVKFARPHALCPYCKGGGNKGCKTCRKSGWMPVEVYNAVPEVDR